MKRIILTALVLCSLILTACGAASNSPQADTTTTSGSLPAATQLTLGILKLDETDHAVTAVQAAELLPLWQVYRELLNSDTAAQEEIDALAEQVQESMTTEQMQTITAMNLSQQDIIAALQTYGMGTIQDSNTVNSANSTNLQNGGMAAPPIDGGGPAGAGAPPDGGMAGIPMLDSQNQSAAQNGTASPQMNPAELLLDPLIELLQNKAGS
jgi:hypothetical protein